MFFHFAGFGSVEFYYVDNRTDRTIDNNPHKQLQTFHLTEFAMQSIVVDWEVDFTNTMSVKLQYIIMIIYELNST